MNTEKNNKSGISRCGQGRRSDRSPLPRANVLRRLCISVPAEGVSSAIQRQKMASTHGFPFRSDEERLADSLHKTESAA